MPRRELDLEHRLGEMTRALVGLLALGTASLGMAACGDDSSSGRAEQPPVPTERDFQMRAREAVGQSLRDPGTVMFRDVHAYRIEVGAGTAYAFCGELKARGGAWELVEGVRRGQERRYSGYERFVAGPGIVGTPSTVQGFGMVWDRLCDPTTDAASVAF